MKLDKKTISDFYAQYAENLDEVIRLEQEQREQGADIVEWIQKYKDRATSIYKIFLKNEEEIRKVLSPFLKGTELLDDDLAEYFLDEIVELRKSYYGDSLISREMLKVIVDYYENHPPKELDNYVIALGLMGAYEDVLGMDGHFAKAVDYDTRTVAFSEHYLTFKKPEAQRRMFYAFYNRVLSEIKRDDFSSDRLCAFVDAACEFYGNKEHQKVEGYPYEEYMLFAKARSHLSMISLVKSDPNCTKEAFVNACIAAVSNYEFQKCQGKTDDDMALLVYLNYVLSCYHTGEMNANEAFERIYHRYLNVDRNLDFSDLRYHDADFFEVINSYAPELVALVEKTDYPHEKVKNIKEEITTEVLQLFVMVPHGRRNDVTNNFMLEAFRYVLPYYQLSGNDLETVLTTALTRENATAIHSNMVKNIAVEIVKSIVFNKPELFVGTLGLNTKEEVEANLTGLLEYVRVAAYSHDIGKLAIGDIINIQYREITNTEFGIIRCHPEIGAEVLSKIPYLQQFVDIALGHQKSYDGMSGYPQFFNNRKSPQAIWIDIISVADCIDAATDSLGRVYKKAKSCEEIIEELAAEAGRRYHPEITELLRRDVNLRETLHYITSEGRDNYYFDVYRHMERM